MTESQSSNVIQGPWRDATKEPTLLLPSSITFNVTVNNVYLQTGIPLIAAGSSAPSMLPPGEVKYKMPGGWITSFIDTAMKEAQIKQYPNGYFYGEIPSCQGVWATGDTKEECISTLQEALEGWILFKLHDNDKDFPVYGDINLNAEWKEDVSWAGSK